MAGKRKGSVLWNKNIQALVTEDEDVAMRAYAMDWHENSISKAARALLVPKLKELGYLPAKD